MSTHLCIALFLALHCFDIENLDVAAPVFDPARGLKSTGNQRNTAASDSSIWARKSCVNCIRFDFVRSLICSSQRHMRDLNGMTCIASG